MAVFWVQQWWALPVIFEEPGIMGDQPRESGRAPVGRVTGNVPSHGLQDDSSELSSMQGPGGRVPNPNASYIYPPQGASAQQRIGNPLAFSMSGQPSGMPNLGPERLEGSFDMLSMAGALPNYRPPLQSFGSSQGQQRFSSNAPSPYLQQQAHQQQQEQTSQLSGQNLGNVSGYNTGISSQYLPSFGHGQQGPSASSQYTQQQASHSTRSILPSPLQQSYSNTPYFQSHQQPAQSYMIYPGSYGPVTASQPGFAASGRQPEGPLNVITGDLSSQGHFPTGGAVAFGYSAGGPFLRPSGPSIPQRESSGSSAGSAQAAIPSAPRGPPRKPKQSGHALWVGNLPPGTKVTDLKDHFSREATTDIESVFLISKSNCAFVNYRTEAACAAAMTRFHDSRFQGVRLVCRLRRTAPAPAPGVPTGPAALAPSFTQTQSASEAIQHNREVSSKAEQTVRESGGAGKVNDKYFIVKSLTVEDLELSARTGVWATQAHNEEALNKAYESVDNVYLICSANKSGEYFGYARMASPINEDNASKLDWAPKMEAVRDDPDLPRSIPTAATEFAPKGRIIDDSARGTIFWEAEPIAPEHASDEQEVKAESSPDEGEDGPPEGASGTQTFGKPFKIEWLSTTRVPFYRTRGLRNPWNANREVKIARDGTELETSVGRRLVQMFHRPAGGLGMAPPPPMAGLGMGLNYPPPMRPPY